MRKPIPAGVIPALAAAGLCIALLCFPGCGEPAAPHVESKPAEQVSSTAPCCDEAPEPVVISDDRATEDVYGVERVAYVVPDLTLEDQHGEARNLRRVLEPDENGVVLLDFVFTTCSTICPVMTATFSTLQDELTNIGVPVRMVSVSIDPEYDTPRVLDAYAEQHGAGDDWVFLTGAASDVQQVVGAFDALFRSKMGHRPFTYLKVSGESDWTRLEGLGGAAPLARAVREALHAEDGHEHGPTGHLGTHEHANADDPLVALGRSIYLYGTLPDGRSVSAHVAGDVPVDGTLARCVSCHQASGLGSLEAWLVAPPVTGWALDEVRTGGPRPRPAYVAGDLATALREGVDPGGNELRPPMPRYALSDTEVAGLAAYLQTLSAEVSPGVTAEEIHFATVTTESPLAEDMLALLRLHVDERNRGTRNEMGRVRAGAFYRAQHETAYRRWVLHDWRLHGPSEDWPAQLEEYARGTPVFALVAGHVDGPWSPIHDFCERHDIPALLPNTDLPHHDADDGRTVYFSAGVALEAEVLAEELLDERVDRVLVLHDGSRRMVAAVAALARGLDGECRVDVLDVGPDGAALVAGLAAAIGTDDEPDLDAVVAWLEPSALTVLSDAWDGAATAPALYVSTLGVEGNLEVLPEALRGQAWLLHAFSMPDVFERRFLRTGGYLRGRGLPIRPGSERMLAQTYFAAKLLGDALMHVRYDHFYRDYLLEVVDHVTSMTPWSAAHPEPSFGPGQRYLSKGCYLLPPGAAPVAETARWVVP